MTMIPPVGIQNNVTKYTYDNVGNVATTTEAGFSIKQSAKGKMTAYTYNRFENVETITDALNNTEVYIYSSSGHPGTHTDRTSLCELTDRGRICSEPWRFFASQRQCIRTARRSQAEKHDSRIIYL